ncbi:DUF7680 family protein [Promicromonospora sp. MS192]|uniref:DUF7680 family protein n=1 Tax=Promicromonospora sp. MS192 TaxID=3412684 RepID=UPI003C2DA8CA
MGEAGFGVTLSEQLGTDGPVLDIAHATHKQAARIAEDVVACVRRSGRGASALAFAGNEPIEIPEPDGVRLALVVLATAPYTSRLKARYVADGIAAMSSEEAYYWYAKCVTDSSRALRALRVLLVL